MTAKASGTKKAASTPKRPPARRPKAPAAPVVSPATGFEVLRLVTTPGTQAETVPLFSIDGVEYSIVRKPKVNIGLKYLHLAATQGEAMAIAYLLPKLLGEEGFLALCEYDDLEEAHLQFVMKTASDIAMGVAEVPKA
jgi:hypothetical protein